MVCLFFYGSNKDYHRHHHARIFVHGGFGGRDHYGYRGVGGVYRDDVLDSEGFFAPQVRVLVASRAGHVHYGRFNSCDLGGRRYQPQMVSNGGGSIFGIEDVINALIRKNIIARVLDSVAAQISNYDGTNIIQIPHHRPRNQSRSKGRTQKQHLFVEPSWSVGSPVAVLTNGKDRCKRQAEAIAESRGLVLSIHRLDHRQNPILAILSDKTDLVSGEDVCGSDLVSQQILDQFEFGENGLVSVHQEESRRLNSEYEYVRAPEIKFLGGFRIRDPMKRSKSQRRRDKARQQQQRAAEEKHEPEPEEPEEPPEEQPPDELSPGERLRELIRSCLPIEVPLYREGRPRRPTTVTVIMAEDATKPGAILVNIPGCGLREAYFRAKSVNANATVQFRRGSLGLDSTYYIPLGVVYDIAMGPSRGMWLAWWVVSRRYTRGSHPLLDPNLLGLVLAM